MLGYYQFLNGLNTTFLLVDNEHCGARATEKKRDLKFFQKCNKTFDGIFIFFLIKDI